MECKACHASIPDGSAACPRCGQVVPRQGSSDHTLGSSLPSSAALVESQVDSTVDFQPGAILRPGVVFASRYEVIAPIGRGGMGTVYQARDKHLDEVVALKLILPQLTPMGWIVDRFKHEIRLARQLSHPNIIKVYDLGQHEDVIYLSMEYLEGTDLRQVIHEQGALPLERGIEIARQICSGLAFAHENSVIHRDVKPHNMFLTKRGRVKLLDFGLAKAIDVSQVSLSGQALGTPAYMSPEQAVADENVPLDHRTDLYSLGVVLFQMFTGEVPFKGTSAIEVALSHVQKAPKRPREVRADLPEHINAVILKAMAKDRNHRYSSALEIASDLAGETRHWAAAAEPHGQTRPVDRGPLRVPKPAPTKPAPSRQGPQLDGMQGGGRASDWAPILGDEQAAEGTPGAESQAVRPGMPKWLIPGSIAIAIALGLLSFRLGWGPFAGSKGGARAPSAAAAKTAATQPSQADASPAPLLPAPPMPRPSPSEDGSAGRSAVAISSGKGDSKAAPGNTASPSPTPKLPPKPTEPPAAKDVVKESAAKDAAKTGPGEARPTPATPAPASPAPEIQIARAEPSPSATPATKPAVAPVPSAVAAVAPTPGAVLPKGKQTMLDIKKQVCESGDGEVCHDLAALFQEGEASEGISSDTALANTFYEKSCAKGVAEGCIDGGMLRKETGDAPGAMNLLQQGCKLRSAQSCFNLGKMVNDGADGTRDAGRAALLFRQACEGSWAAGCTSLGLLYEAGEGVERDLGRSLDLFQRGCKGGSTAGCTNVARVYQAGAAEAGVKQDLPKAADAYEEECGRGGATACNNLAYLVENGWGRTRDLAKAASLYQKACDGGNKSACAAADRLSQPPAAAEAPAPQP